MTKIEKSGSSIESVIAAFRQEHKIKDWELKYEVIKRPRSGFLGLFASKTAILSFELPQIEDRVRLFLQMMLSKMGVSFELVKARKEGKNIYLEIKGLKEPGFLIGKNGFMLETIQYYLNRVYDADRRLSNIYLDSDGYKERKDQQFLKPFLPMINETRHSGKALTLNPMQSSQRRVIHQYVQKQKGLRTLTIGDGDEKRIVVFSSKLSEKDVLNQNGEKQGKSSSATFKKTAAKGKQKLPQEQKTHPNIEDKPKKPKYYPNRRPPKRGDQRKKTEES